MEESWQAGKSQQAGAGPRQADSESRGPRCCLLDRARIMTIITEIPGAVINAHLASQDRIFSIHLTALRAREGPPSEIWSPCFK